MMPIQVELHSHRLGGSALLIPFDDIMLASTTCRELLQVVLSEHLQQPYLLVTIEKVSFFTIKHHDKVSDSNQNTRVDKDLANATACLDMPTMSAVIESFSTQSFKFTCTSMYNLCLIAKGVEPHPESEVKS